MKYRAAAIIVFLCWAANLGARDTTGTVHHPILTGDNRIPISTWRYHGGDDPTWAAPETDDSDWDVVDPVFEHGSDPVDDWEGTGWFRAYFEADSSMFDRTVALVLNVNGFADVYLNGRPTQTVGSRETLRDPNTTHHFNFPLIRLGTLAPHAQNVIAVRLEEHPPFGYRFCETGDFAAFKMYATSPLKALADVEERLTDETRMRTFFATAALTIAFVHLLLFVFSPAQSMNLYYALFTIGAAAIAYLPLKAYFVTNLVALAPVLRMLGVAVVFTTLAGLLFLYSIFYERLPRKLFAAWVAGGAGVTIWKWNGPSDHMMLFSLIAFIEIMRVLILATIRRKPFAWMILIGCTAFIMTSAYSILGELTSISRDFRQSDYIYLYGMLAMLVFMSIALARRFAGINTDLQRNLEEVKNLSARAIENERIAKEQEMERIRLQTDNELKARELEEARKRQEVLDELAAANAELRTAQTQLVQSEKMAALGSLVAGVAHEINTPVGAITSMHNTLVRAVEKLRSSIEKVAPGDYDRNPGIVRPLQLIDDANKVIESGSRRVTNIVKRLRSFARLDEAELKRVDIREGIEDTLTLVHHELKRDVTVRRQFGDVPAIPCYPGQLNQVFLNLLVNARQAMPEGGEITIRTSQDNDRVIVEIADTGIGIPQDKLQKVFDPGFTTKGVGVGTGLGLSICYQIVQAHRGMIHATSELGKGTTFHIELPTDLDRVLEQKGVQTAGKDRYED